MDRTYGGTIDVRTAGPPDWLEVQMECVLCWDEDCMVRVRMRLAPETIPGEGEAWVSGEVRTDCGRKIREPLEDHLMWVAEMLANR